MRRFSRSSGFSLIELMIVLSIISILTSLAIPSFREYAQRARFSDVIVATYPFKLAVALALQQGIPASELSLGSSYLPPEPKASKHLSSLSVSSGIITAISTKLAGASSYILTPNQSGNTWSVSGSCLLKRLCHDD